MLFSGKRRMSDHRCPSSTCSRAYTSSVFCAVDGCSMDFSENWWFGCEKYLDQFVTCISCSYIVCVDCQSKEQFNCRFCLEIYEQKSKVCLLIWWMKSNFCYQKDVAKLIGTIILEDGRRPFHKTQHFKDLNFK